MSTGQDLVDAAMLYVGVPYVLGAEGDLDPGHQPVVALDCSELVQVALADLGIGFVDGTWNQIRECITIDIETGYATPGALLFTAGLPDHVAISRGDGTTVEARGRAYGTGVFPARNRFFVSAGLVPGLNYGTMPPDPLEDDMTGPEFAAAIGGKWDAEKGHVMVPLFDHFDENGVAVYKDYTYADAMTFTHQEAKYIRLGIH